MDTLQGEEMAARTPEEVIQRAEENLHTARLGLDDLKEGSGPRKSSGLKNVVIWGRSITNVLQKLRGFPNLAFDEWYARYEDEMANDELMKFFYRLRSDILKEGEPVSLQRGYYIKDLNLEDFEQYAPKPRGATGIFIDALGAGWTIGDVDGDHVKYYVPLPDDVASPIGGFDKPPHTHLGHSVEGMPQEQLAQLYFDYLSRMLKDARKRFVRGN
jgi:hypothetical protein